MFLWDVVGFTIFLLSRIFFYGRFLARSKTWKTRKFFSKIFKSEFSVLAIGQNRKLGNKKTRNNISEISEISEVSEFSICHFFISFLIFFSFFINVFSGSFFYICNFSSTLYKYSSFISLTKYEFMCLCFDL